MKRLNRKKLIQEFETLRQGFSDVFHFVKLNKTEKTAVAAFHYSANKAVEELGGEKVPALVERKETPDYFDCKYCKRRPKCQWRRENYICGNYTRDKEKTK